MAKRIQAQDLRQPGAAEVRPQQPARDRFFPARTPRRQIGATDFASLSRTLASAVQVGQKAGKQEDFQAGAQAAREELEELNDQQDLTAQQFAKAIATGQIEASDSPFFAIARRRVLARGFVERYALAADEIMAGNAGVAGDTTATDAGTPVATSPVGEQLNTLWGEMFSEVGNTNPELAADFYFREELSKRRGRLDPQLVAQGNRQLRAANEKVTIQGFEGELSKGSLRIAALPLEERGDAIKEWAQHADSDGRKLSIPEMTTRMKRGLANSFRQIAQGDRIKGASAALDHMEAMGDVMIGTQKYRDTNEFIAVTDEMLQREKTQQRDAGVYRSIDRKAEVDAWKDAEDGDYLRVIQSDPDERAALIGQFVQNYQAAGDPLTKEKIAELTALSSTINSAETLGAQTITEEIDRALRSNNYLSLDELRTQANGLQDGTEKDNVLQRIDDWDNVARTKAFESVQGRSTFARANDEISTFSVKIPGVGAQLNRDLAEDFADWQADYAAALIEPGADREAVEDAFEGPSLDALLKRNRDRVALATEGGNAFLNDANTIIKTGSRDQLTALLADPKNAPFVNADIRDTFEEKMRTYELNELAALERTIQPKQTYNRFSDLLVNNQVNTFAGTTELSSGPSIEAKWVEVDVDLDNVRTITPTQAGLDRIQEAHEEHGKRMREWQSSEEGRDARSLAPYRWNEMARKKSEEVFADVAREFLGFTSPEQIRPNFLDYGPPSILQGVGTTEPEPSAAPAGFARPGDPTPLEEGQEDTRSPRRRAIDLNREGVSARVGEIDWWKSADVIARDTDGGLMYRALDQVKVRSGLSGLTMNSDAARHVSGLGLEQAVQVRESLSVTARGSGLVGVATTSPLVDRMWVTGDLKVHPTAYNFAVNASNGGGRLGSTRKDANTRKTWNHQWLSAIEATDASDLEKSQAAVTVMELGFFDPKDLANGFLFDAQAKGAFPAFKDKRQIQLVPGLVDPGIHNIFSSKGQMDQWLGDSNKERRNALLTNIGFDTSDETVEYIRTLQTNLLRQ